MVFQGTHEDRLSAEAPAAPGKWFSESPLQRTLTGQAREGTRANQSELVDRDIAVAVRVAFSCEAH